MNLGKIQTLFYLSVWCVKLLMLLLNLRTSKSNFPPTHTRLAPHFGFLFTNKFKIISFCKQRIQLHFEYSFRLKLGQHPTRISHWMHARHSSAGAVVAFICAVFKNNEGSFAIFKCKVHKTVPNYTCIYIYIYAEYALARRPFFWFSFNYTTRYKQQIFTRVHIVHTYKSWTLRVYISTRRVRGILEEIMQHRKHLALIAPVTP